MNNIQLSIIILSLNFDNNIEECLKNIINNNLNIEIILICYLFSDNEKIFINNLTNKENNKIYFKNIFINNKLPGGYGFFYNLGIDNSCGKYILFTNSFNMFHNDYISIMYETITKNKSDLSICNYNLFYNNNLIPSSDYYLFENNSNIYKSNPILSRVIYYKQFLINNSLRFPIGDFYFENLTFYINSISKSDKISFINKTLFLHLENKYNSFNFLIENYEKSNYFFYIFNNFYNITNKEIIKEYIWTKDIINNNSKFYTKFKRIFDNFSNEKYTYELSIIIPIYNSLIYIENLKNLIDIIPDNFEIIFIDDCSTDNSKNILQEYTNKNNISFYLKNTNSGPGRSRNCAIPMIEGKYTLFFDSDDEININNLNLALNVLNKKNLDLLFINYINIFGCDLQIYKDYKNNKNKYELYKLNNYPFNRIIKSEIIIKNNIHFGPTYIHEDSVYHWLSIYYSNNIDVFETPVINYKKNKNGLTFSLKNRENCFYAMNYCKIILENEHKINDEKLLNLFRETVIKITNWNSNKKLSYDDKIIFNNYKKDFNLENNTPLINIFDFNSFSL